MPTGYNITDFDRQHERLTGPHAPSQEARKRTAQLSRVHVQQRLKAILDADAVIVINGVSHTMPALEAMVSTMVQMALGKGEFASVKDKDRIAAFKAVCDRVLGAPKQTIEHVQQEATNEDLDNLTDAQLQALEQAHERVLASPVTKSL